MIQLHFRGSSFNLQNSFFLFRELKIRSVNTYEIELQHAHGNLKQNAMKKSIFNEDSET